MAGIELIHRANGGPAAARKDDLERVRTKLMAFLDAEDYWSVDALEEPELVLELSLIQAA